MTDEIILGILTFFTSTVAGVVGLGGGMLLIAVLPTFLPLNAIIPVHGVTQMSSNISRAIFGIKDVQFEVLPKFIFGSIVIPYFYLGMVMNGVRYGLAFSLAVLAASYLLKRQSWWFWQISIIAGLSHLSALVLVFLLYIQSYLKNRLPAVVFTLGGGSGVMVFFFYDYLVTKFNAYENILPPSSLSGLATFIISLCTLMIWFFDAQLRKNKQAIFSLFLLIVLSYALAQITYAGIRFQFLIVFLLVLSIQFQMAYWNIKLGKKAAYMAIFTGFVGLMSKFRNMLDGYGAGESPFLPYVFFWS